jgi:electron transfer flavoprotein beta subunit
MVITGRQAADWDVGIVGCGIAEILGWPVVCVAGRTQVEGRLVEVDRSLEDGNETVRSPLPCVVTASNEVGAPRKPSLRETMKSAKKQILVRELEELWSVDQLKAAGLMLPRRVGLSARSSSVECTYLADDVKTAAQEIFKLLRADVLGRGGSHA